MTPAARVSAAIGVLDAWLEGAPAERALTNWARGARYAGSADRAAVRDHVYDALRALGSCRALSHGGGDGRALMLGLMRLQGLDPAAVFTGEGHAPAPMSEAEARAPQVVPAADADVPGWLLPEMAARAGADLNRLLDTFRHRAPVWLRVNTRKASLPEAMARLEADGIASRADARAARALEVMSGARRVKQSEAYLQGLVELQDLSAQRAVERVAWPDGRILDYCAGGGGKALALAALSDAAIHAHDASPARMRDLPARAGRAGARIRVIAPGEVGGSAPFDAVLCDVPCSGSGTWRRDPEAKWRLTPGRLRELEAVQARILAEAAALVRPGGLLVYMTCSLLACENEAQVDGFIAAHPGWRPLSQGIDTPLTASDGFYHAVLSAPPEQG